jgi:hypothetical protein
MLSKIFELAKDVKMMWGKLIDAIEGQLGLFCLDPSSFLSGSMSLGQIDAYKFCASGLMLTNSAPDCVKC